MLFTDLLSLHLVTFLMFLILVLWYNFSAVPSRSVWLLFAFGFHKSRSMHAQD